MSGETITDDEVGRMRDRVGLTYDLTGPKGRARAAECLRRIIAQISDEPRLDPGAAPVITSAEMEMLDGARKCGEARTVEQIAAWLEEEGQREPLLIAGCMLRRYAADLRAGRWRQGEKAAVRR